MNEYKAKWKQALADLAHVNQRIADLMQQLENKQHLAETEAKQEAASAASRREFQKEKEAGAKLADISLATTVEDIELMELKDEVLDTCDDPRYLDPNDILGES